MGALQPECCSEAMIDRLLDDFVGKLYVQHVSKADKDIPGYRLARCK